MVCSTRLILAIFIVSIPLRLASSVECPRSLIQGGRSSHGRVLANESTNLSVSDHRAEPSGEAYDDTRGVEILKQLIGINRGQPPSKPSLDNPNLGEITKYAIGLLVGLLVFDITVHVADQSMKDAQKRLMLDHLVDAFVACFGMIVCFVWYSLIQEFILQHEYPSGDTFPDASFLLLSDKIFAIVVAGIAILIAQSPFQWEAGKLVLGPGFLDYVANYLIDKSVAYLAYPVVTVFKCSRVVPVMAFNTLLNGEQQGVRDYILAILICAGVYGFNFFNAGDSSPPEKNNGVLGIQLIVMGILCGALTSTSEKWIFRKYEAFSQMSMLFSINVIGGVFGFIVCKVMFGFAVFFTFIHRNPSAIGHMFMLSSSCTLGCYLVFYVLDHHGPVTVSISILIKQILAIYMSAVLYNHVISPAARLCAMLTFMAVMAKPLLKYMDEDTTVPLKVGQLRKGLNITAALRKTLGHEVTASATVLIAAARLKASIDANREKVGTDADADMRAYRMAFAIIAGDGNSSVDRAGFGKVLNALGHAHSDDEVEVMLDESFPELKGKKDASITFEQFVSLMKTLKRKQNEDLLEAFKVFDEDHSGSISKDELLHTLTSLGENVSEADVSKMIACYDLDKDGKIDFAEFKQMMDM